LSGIDKLVSDWFFALELNSVAKGLPFDSVLLRNTTFDQPFSKVILKD
jgi:hypothetical protein